MVALRLFLADDHEIVRFWIEKPAGVAVRMVGSGEAGNGKRLSRKVFLLEPDVALLDIKHAGVKWARRGTRDTGGGSRTKILILSVHDSQEVIQQVLDFRGQRLRAEVGCDARPDRGS